MKAEEEEVDARLVEHVGPEAALALQRSGWLNGRKVSVPSDAWTAHGFSGAFVAPIVVTEAGGPPIYCLAKVCPESRAGESATHRAALESSPRTFAARHLIELPMDAIALPSGGAVLFQRVAGDSPDYVAASGVSDEAMVDFCRTVPSTLITGWNPDFGHEPMTIEQLLDSEARESLAGSEPVGEWAVPVGLLHRAARWISLDGTPALPNPLVLTREHPVVGEVMLDVLVGRSHGDLHLENVLWRESPAGPRRSRFYLIDMDTFRQRAPLVRDQLNLTLAVVAQQWEKIDDGARARLLHHLVSLERVHRTPPHLPPVFTMMRGAYAPARRAVAWPDWWKQYLVTMQATALRFTSYVGLGPGARWWFLQLAARSAAALLAELDIELPVSRPLAIGNPFGPAGASGRASPRSTQRAGSDRYRPPLRGDGLLLGGLPVDWTVDP